MLFKNHKDGTHISVAVEPMRATRELTEALHKVLGALLTISKAMHNMFEALLNGEVGPNEVIYTTHGLSHSLMSLVNMFIEASPIHAFDPKVAQDWIHRESVDYMAIVLDPLIRQIQKEVDQANARDSEREGNNEIDVKISELEAMVAAGRSPTLPQIMEVLSMIHNLQNPGQQTQTVQGPTAEPKAETPSLLSGEIKDVTKDRPQPTTKRPRRRNLRN